VNLLSPGETPYENAQFLTFLCAVIQAVDDYADLLRISVATAGNDHRLGANEAPPAVVSIFLGDELTAVLDAIEGDKPYSAAEKTVMKLGADVLPKFRRDATDRNRTSPFAFTGNKFEFRMLGSSNSIACANIMLNAAVAESLKQYADRLEKAEDFESELHAMIREVIREHSRIIFNGNGYDDKWIEEATKVRGLKNYRTTPDCFPELLSEKNVSMLTSHGVFTMEELRSRYEIMLENYCKTVLIEANTMIDMTRRQILPAVVKYASVLASDISSKKAVCPDLSCRYETHTSQKLSELADGIAERVDELEEAAEKARGITEIGEQSFAIRDSVLGRMNALRSLCDEAEKITATEYWPYPTYGDLLFGVK
ncbi:MAG: glutamine synthetase type III, partial [Firmicutes bacterium]|nr:glutamine synthetase type III [Bacillota bacterium]